VKPVRFLNSLITQILLFLVILAVAISIASVTTQMRISREGTHDKYASQAEIAVQLAASFISAEDVDFYLETLEADDKYYRLLDILKSIQTMSGMTYVFVTKIVDGGELFIFDTDPKADTHVELGGFSDWVESGLDSSLQVVLSAGKKPTPYISETEWGFFLTAREPIYRYDWTTAGYVGANFYMGTVLAAQARLFRINIIVTIFIFVTSVAVYFLIVYKLVAAPLRTLTTNVGRLSAGEVLSQVLVSSKNEFSLLEATFADMSKRNAFSKKITDVLNKTAIIFLSQSEGAFDDTMTHGLKLFCDALNLDRVSVWRNFHRSDELHVSQIYRWDRESGGTTKPLSGLEDITYVKLAPRWEQLLAEGKSINGPTRLLFEAAMVKSFGIVSIFVEPLFINNAFWGFVLFGDIRGERYFDDDSIDVMRSAALLCANTVIINEKTQNERKANEVLERRMKYTNALNRTLEIFVSHAEKSIDAVMGNGLWPVADVTSLDRILVFRARNPQSNDANERKSGEIYRWDRAGHGSVPIDDELKTLPVTTALKRWLGAMMNDECVSLRRSDFTEDEAAFLTPRGVRSILIVPVFAERGLWGVTTFHDNIEERDFDDECIAMLRSVARLCVNMLQRTEMENAISNAEKNARELKIEADKIYYDALTDIYSRRYFDESMKRIINSLSRSDSLLSLLMIDIDFFKRYNDTYGHVEGDKCLKIVAQTLSRSITRADDFVARYGGEEFVVVLPNTDEQGAQLIAEKLLENIRKCNIPHEQNDAANCLTISIGATTSKAAYTHTVDDFVKKADEMLYKSKQNGRNRYSFGQL
jgi:diguanylate cyclase (GGDEF)-like protein